MTTVAEVADRYQCSTTLVVTLLAKIGFHAAQPETPLSAATVHRFDREWGDKIRAARPAPKPVESVPAFTGETDIAPTATRDVNPKHVMRIAHAKIGSGRDATGNRESQLLEDPGMVHAIDLAGTRDGDPWRGNVRPGEVHFFGGVRNSGPPAACGTSHMRAALSDEFEPAQDPARANQCPRCAEAVATGSGFRNPPDPFGSYRSYFCEAYLRIRIDGKVTVKSCFLRDFHDGPHRAGGGAEWTIGVDDYVPASDEIGSHITAAS